MNRRLLARALCALLLAAAPAAAQDEAAAYKFTDGGVQFTLPAGWAA